MDNSKADAGDFAYAEMARIDLRQASASLQIEVDWSQMPAQAPVFELRSLRDGDSLGIPAETVGTTSRLAINLGALATERNAAWSLWVFAGEVSVPEVLVSDGDPQPETTTASTKSAAATRVNGELWRRVGDAAHMSASVFREVSDGGRIACPRVSGRRSFVIKTGRSVRRSPSISSRLVQSKDRLKWRGRAHVPSGADTDAVLVVVERTSRIEHRYPIRSERIDRQTSLYSHYDLSFDIAWREIATELPSDWVDFYIEFDVEGEKVRLGVPRAPMKYRVFRRFRSVSVSHGEVVRYFGPFYTFKARRLAAHVSTLPVESAHTMAKTRRFLRVRRWWHSHTHKPIWVIGETGYKAQDTGLEFFKFVRSNHPEIDARFVIEADAPDRQRAEDVGPVLIAGTPEHVEAILLAERIVTSHHPEYIYPVRTADFKTSVRATKVFLQHGVLGTKWIANLYGRGRAGFEADAFMVSSDFEKRLVERDFGYKPAQVFVTGLSRFDSLLEPSDPVRQLLIIPTWRDWISSDRAFLESGFYEEWLGLLASDGFKELIRVSGWKIKLIMHPNFRQFSSTFAAAGVEVVHQGEVTVQELLRESAVLLTDYSSVAFDFALQNRPVVYFQFDRHRFLGRHGSHMDLDAVLPGKIAFTADGVVEALASALADEPAVREQEFARAQMFFPMMDRNSSARIFDGIVAAKPRRISKWHLRAARVRQALYRRWRHSRFYFPVAKAFYKCARLLPVDDKWVVFESGLGRKYGDSPKAIFKELDRQNQTMRKTWFYEGQILDVYASPERVPRFSLRYYYALARAKYWVNDQSFPHYIRRRRSQVFLQTWHGTPLKRMLHDLDEVHGRDSGYVNRATVGAAQWSILTSPNPYTTNIMKSAFKYDGDALELGYARNDILHGKAAREAATRVRVRLGLPRDKPIVLFAPTFRDRALDSDAESAPTAAIDLPLWLSELGDTATLLLRRHTLDKARAPLPEGNAGRILDVSAYPDIQELLAAADVLVTDYSSLYFDYLNLRRPIVFFAPDLEDYRDVLRGFYLDYSTDLPGPVATTATQARGLVREALTSGCFSGYDLDAFAERFCPHDDGHAAQRIVDYIFPVAEDR